MGKNKALQVQELEPFAVINNWLRTRSTIEYLGLWEKINNPDFNYPEFRIIEQEADTNRLIITVGQWIARTNAIGIVSKSGRCGDTFAHKSTSWNSIRISSGSAQCGSILNHSKRMERNKS